MQRKTQEYATRGSEEEETQDKKIGFYYWRERRETTS